MKILLAKDQNTESDILAIALESFFPHLTVHHVFGPKDAKLQLGTEHYDLVVAENRFRSGEDCSDLYKHLLGMPAPSPFVLISDVPVERLPFFAGHPPVAVVMRPLNVSDFVKAISPFLPTPGDSAADVQRNNNDANRSGKDTGRPR